MFQSRFLVAGLLAAATLAMSGCISTGISLGDTDGQVAELSQQELHIPVEHHIAPEDVLQIVVWDVPEFTTSGTMSNMNQANTVRNSGFNYVVHDDGAIDLPLVGTLQIGGLTVNEAKALITEKLRKFIIEPQVGLTISQYNSRKILVLGEVGKPGLVQNPGPKLSLAEALAQAGGVVPMTADTANVYIIRGAMPPPTSTPVVNNEPANVKMIVVYDENGVPYDMKQPAPVQPQNLPRVTRLPLDTAVAMAHAQNMWLQSRDVIFVNSQIITDWNRFMSQLLPSLVDYSALKGIGVVK